MPTKQMRGRDAEQHVVHANRAEADKYKGLHGQITLVADGTDGAATIIELRAHNGVTFGGFAIPLAPASDSTSGVEIARASPTVPVTTTAADEAVSVVHELGYTPSVQVIDENNQVVTNYKVEHVDEDSLVVTLPNPGSYQVILR